MLDLDLKVIPVRNVRVINQSSQTKNRINIFVFFHKRKILMYYIAHTGILHIFC